MRTQGIAVCAVICLWRRWRRPPRRWSASDFDPNTGALINSYCRRPDLNIIQYIERLRVTVSGQ